MGKDWPSIDCIHPQWLLEWNSRRKNGKSMSSLVEDSVLENGKNGLVPDGLVVCWQYGKSGEGITAGRRWRALWEKKG